MASSETREILRRVRLGDVRRLIHHRCRGHTLTEDDAGQEYLIEMLKIVSLGPDPGRRMLNVVEVFAPFMNRPDAERIIASVNRIPAGLRWPKPHILGENLRLTNREREGLCLWSIAPCDITAEELLEQRKRKDRERKKQKRADQGRMTRDQYCAQFTHSINKQKPWVALGIKKRAWQYRQAKARAVATISQPKEAPQATAP
jgi:hypothetical protein